MTERQKPEISKSGAEAKAEVSRRNKMKHVIVSLASPDPEDADKRKYEVIDRSASEEILAPWIETKTGAYRTSEINGSLKYVVNARNSFISDLTNQANLKKSQSERLTSILTAIKAMYPDRVFDSVEDYIDLVGQPTEGYSEKIQADRDAWKTAQDDTKPPPPPIPGSAANAEIDMDAFLRNLRSADHSPGMPFGGPLPPTPSRVNQSPLQDIYTVVSKRFQK